MLGPGAYHKTDKEDPTAENSAATTKISHMFASTSKREVIKPSNGKKLKNLLFI